MLVVFFVWVKGTPSIFEFCLLDHANFIANLRCSKLPSTVGLDTNLSCRGTFTFCFTTPGIGWLKDRISVRPKLSLYTPRTANSNVLTCS